MWYYHIGFSSRVPPMLYYQSEREHSYVQNRLSILYSQAERPCLSTGKGVFVAGSPSWAGRCKNLISYIYQLKRPLEMDVALRLKLFTMRTMRALCTLERVDVRSRFQINTAEWFNGVFLCIELTHDFKKKFGHELMGRFWPEVWPYFKREKWPK